MEQNDPFATLRSSATLEAYRARHKAALSTARPFLIIGLCSCSLGLLLGWLQTRGHDIQAISFADVAAICIGGLSIAIGRLKVNHYLRDHPLDRRR